MSKMLISLLAAAGLAFAGAAGAANDKTTMSRDAYKADKDKIEAQYKVEKDKCDGLSGNQKDICQAEAKGHEKVAKAELEANYKNTDRARYEAREARAEATYDVAKEKCDDLKGNDKDVCVKEAKAALTKAKADAKVARVTNTQTMRTSTADNRAPDRATNRAADARKDAAEDKRDADYKVAKEKCDALSGDAKDKCVNDAKARYGKT
jgi:hypothetical protein